MNNMSPSIFPLPYATEWGEDVGGLWCQLTLSGVNQIFRWIEPGEFMMGSPENEKGRWDGQEDHHQVEIVQGFWLADTPVTQDLWQGVTKTNPSQFTGKALPVEKVSWLDTQDFFQKCRVLYPELDFRLPYEAEWEYACRAGSDTAFHFGENLSLDQVNYRGSWGFGDDPDDKRLSQTSDIKAYSANDWGLYDMHGNVWEWCQDGWQAELGKGKQVFIFDEQVVNDDVEIQRVVRGGSWGRNGGYLRSAVRSGLSPAVRGNDLGFRLSLGH